MARKKSRKNSAYHSLQLPNRQMLGRLGQLFALTMVSGILVMGQAGNPHVRGLKNQLGDAMAPVLAFAARPFDSVSDFTTAVKNWGAVHTQNMALREENARLLQWQSKAQEMQAENASLRSLLNVVPARKMRFMTAQIVSDQGSAFTHSALLNAGTEEGMAKGQAVINERGLVGRVVEAGAHSARVLLLSDMRSRVPVINERTREKMILAGNNLALPALTYVPTNSPTKAGDRIVTSGDGGVFPKGIAVGMVKEPEKGKMFVEPYVNPAQAEYVSVVDYAL